MNFAEPKIVLNGLANTSNQTSDLINIKQRYGVSAVTVFTGAPNGTFNLEVSNDGENWAVLQSQSVTGAGNLATNFDGIHFLYARLAWVNSASASGTMTSTYSGKGA